MKQVVIGLLVGIPCALWMIKHLLLVVFPHLRYEGKYPVVGSIVITSLPSGCMHCNTEAMRTLWVGCRIDGELLSWRTFQASYQSCFDALIRKHGEQAARPYIDFWLRFAHLHEQLHPGPLVSTDGIRLIHHYSLIFNDCFHFIPEKCRDEPLLTAGCETAT